MNNITFMYFKKPLYTVYNSKKGFYQYPPSSEGQSVTLQYPEFVNTLTRRVTCDCKGQSGSVLFGEFHQGQTHRCSSNIKNRNCVVLEIDGILESDRDRVRNGLKKMGKEVIGYSSFSHLADGRICRMHFVFPLERAVFSKQDYSAVYYKTKDMFLTCTGLKQLDKTQAELSAGYADIDDSAASWALVMYMPCTRKGLAFHWLYIQGEFMQADTGEDVVVYSLKDTENKTVLQNCGNAVTQTKKQVISDGHNISEITVKSGVNCSYGVDGLTGNKEKEIYLTEQKGKTSGGEKQVMSVKEKKRLERNKHRYSVYAVQQAFDGKYSAEYVMDCFLSDVYQKQSPRRYKYIPSSSVAGVVLTDDNRAVSFHTSDPASGNRGNSPFWLLAKHKFSGSALQTARWITDNGWV